VTAQDCTRRSHGRPWTGDGYRHEVPDGTGRGAPVPLVEQALIEGGFTVQNRRMPIELSVRPTAEDERARVLDVVREAFSGEVGDGREVVEIVEAIWSLAAPVVGGDLVAVSGGEIIGHVLASLGKLDGLATPGIAPLAVRPDRQDRGVGTALMTELLRQLDQRGFPLVVVLGDPGYYGRFGFEPSGPLGIHYLPIGADDPHFQVLRLGDHHEACTGDYVYSWEAPVG